MITLTTSRLQIRPFTPADVEAFSAYRSDPEVARYQGWEAPYSLAQAEQFVAEMQALAPGLPGEWYQLALVRCDDAVMIGDVAFQTFSGTPPRQAEIGITLAPAYQGQGYGQEAAATLLDYLFGELNLHRVRANCDPANLASARLLQRLGFRFEGRWVDSLWFKGAWVSEDWYAILQSEWRARTGQAAA